VVVCLAELHAKIILQAVGKIKSKNWMVVAIDEELRKYCEQHNIRYYYRPVVVRTIVLCSTQFALYVLGE